tara:strand:- start:31 stop:399 length:369 start_codon:yes stop_codon:yes gene_type:complete
LTESFSFRKEARLLRPQEFREVFSSRPHRSQSQAVTIWGRPTQGESARLGIAVPKRVVSRAVDRSRLKRQIRESFRHHRAQLGNWDLVVQLRRYHPAETREQLTADLERLWRRYFRQSSKNR